MCFADEVLGEPLVLGDHGVEYMIRSGSYLFVSFRVLIDRRPGVQDVVVRLNGIAIGCFLDLLLHRDVRVLAFVGVVDGGEIFTRP